MSYRLTNEESTADPRPIDGHSPDVIGHYSRTETESGVTYAPSGGRPSNWSTGPLERNPLPRTETRVTRSRKGRSSFVPVGPRPTHLITTGDVHHVDPVVDMVASLIPCTETETHARHCQCNITERNLIAAADALLSRDDEDWPRLIGNTVTRPQVIAGDRSSMGQVVNGERSAMGAIVVSNGDLGAWFGLDLANGSAVTDQSTRLAWPTRLRISAANRLHTKTQLAKASVAVLADGVDENGRKRRVIGRRMADRTMLASFSDDGWFIGHEHTAQPTGARWARAKRLARHEARIEQHNAHRATVRATTMAESTPTKLGLVEAPTGRSAAKRPGRDTLTTLRAMTVGQTLAGLTRRSASHWTDTNGTTYASHATAAIALHNALTNA